MKKINTKRIFVFTGTLLAVLFSIAFNPGRSIHTERLNSSDGFVLVKNPNGTTLGYAERSGVKILTIGGLAFKDLNKNGQLDKYEDWRLPVDERAKDLASKMSIEQIAGLMLYSAHQAVPATTGGPMGASTYNGQKFNPDSAKASDLTDQQKSFLLKDNLRHILINMVQSP